MNDAREFALLAHGEQRYGKKPYSYHLDAVVALLTPFGETAMTVGFLHDVIEDTSINRSEVAQRFGDFIADCVQILTDEAGANRQERKQKTYAKMAKVSGELELALIVKAADRLANMQACVELDVPEKLAMYKQEHAQFEQAVYRDKLCDQLWEQMKEIMVLA